MPTAPATIAQEDELLSALVKRGQEPDRRFRLPPDDLNDLALEVVSNFNDVAASRTQFILNHLEFTRQWRGVVEPKDWPYENAANVHVPLISYFIEQRKAQLAQAMLGKQGDKAVQFSAMADSVPPETLAEVDEWFDWELRQVVNIDSVMEDVLHYVLVDGFSLVVPEYKRVTKDLVSTREFDLIDEMPLSQQIEMVVQKLFPGQKAQITKTVGGGKYEVEYKGDTGETMKAKLAFWIEHDDTLVAEVAREEVIFDGVKICVLDNEDINTPNSHPDIEGLPFIGWRMWLSAHDFRAGVGKEFLPFTEEEIKEILSHAGAKDQTDLPMAVTSTMDVEEGTDSRDLTLSGDHELGWLEVYRWEGRRLVGKKWVGLAVWVVASANKVIRYERLENLTATGERTPIKFEYIRQPGRFYPIGEAEWNRHSQEEMDAMHCQRLDAGMMSNFPFFFYTPAAGNPNTILQLAPGKGYPIKDPRAVVFPKTNWSPTWSFEEEAQALSYAKLQSGMSDASFGSFISKRASASEFNRTNEATDVRMYMMVRRLLRPFLKLMQRVFELYRRHVPQGRVFQVAGANGERLVMKLQKENLHTPMMMIPVGGSERLDDQLLRDVSVNMFQLLNSPALVQQGIVQGDTLYAATKRIMDAMNYKGIPLHEPSVPPPSEPPEAELRRMMLGEIVEPSPTENFQEHMKKHMRVKTDPAMLQILTPETIALLDQHMMATQALEQQVEMMRQQAALASQETQNQVSSLGIRPGKAGGQQPGDGASNGTQQEGAQGGRDEGQSLQ